MKEALKTAIECLKIFKDNSNGDPMYTHAIKVLEALAQPAQQCLDCGSNNIGVPATYDSLIDSIKTPQRKPMTDEEIKSIEEGIWNSEFFDDTERQANREFARAIEAAHGIKENT